MQSVGQLIQKMSDRPRWPVNKKAILVLRQFSAIVGENLSKNVSLKWIKNGTACIHCRNSMWVFALHSIEEDLIKKMNEVAGEELIHRLLLRIGNVKYISSKKIKIIELSDNDIEWIDQLVGPVPDDIKHSFKNFLRSYKGGQKTDE